jgi:hypothetical protein
MLKACLAGIPFFFLGKLENREKIFSGFYGELTKTKGQNDPSRFLSWETDPSWSNLTSVLIIEKGTKTVKNVVSYFIQNIRL